MKKYDLIVIGSGPAGLAGAAFAAARGKKVLLLEKESRFGGKLPLSGGGRCNVTNVLSPDDMARAFGKKGRFMLPALRNLTPEGVREYFSDRGVEIEVTDGFHCFPRSGKALHLVNALLDECDLYGVEKISSFKVEELLIKEGSVTGVRGGEKRFYAPQVLIACGGKSYPKWCGSEWGYTLARQAGHTITPLYPAMTGLQCTEEWPGLCAGISLADTTCCIDLPGEKTLCRGELLFTHQGISAFAVLDLAGRAAELLQTHSVLLLKLNLFAGTPREEWLQRFALWRQGSGKVSAGKILSEYLPKRLVPYIVPAPETPFARYSAENTRKLLENLTSLTLHARDTENFHKAMVTKGGVSLEEVNTKTLESRLVIGVFFAGEVLDLDGPCGGYNIQWALSSGALCAGQ
ncbi:MAG: aminoacetone oxidase family FAD-binding enzyme [Lentisphaeria bacterium]|nr:aminoacetone oxidase family FAD-binding enzyme [Lentisphaeria bacterium]